MAGQARADEAVLVRLPVPLLAIDQVRSTLLLASIKALRDGGNFERYEATLERRYQDVLLSSVAGMSLPVEVALAHYRACDALGISIDAQVVNGRMTGRGIREHIARIAGAVARGAGVTPWTILEQFPRLWARAFDGGGVGVERVGPKDAKVIYYAPPLLQSRYFRSALRGVALGLIETVATRGYMSEVPAEGDNNRAIYRLRWA